MSVNQEKITVQVGERHYHATKATLAEMLLFNSLFDGRVNAPEDGVYSFDRDAQSFEHILRYCRTKVFPMLHTSIGEFDVSLYEMIREEAEFYGCTVLADWISLEKYRKVHRREHRVHISPLSDGETERQIAEVESPISLRDGEHVSATTVITKTRIVYCCPRGIFSHTEPGRCGRQCNSARGYDGTWFRPREFHYLATTIEKDVVDGCLLKAP